MKNSYPYGGKPYNERLSPAVPSALARSLYNAFNNPVGYPYLMNTADIPNIQTRLRIPKTELKKLPSGG